ncbi:MAG TPA: adenylate kinase [Anaerolineales bacterium]|nr:adenylate kinase [Anaerolineales bacterium]
MAMYLIMLGPPGSGKGTQAKELGKALGLRQISSGDLFREHLKNQTELGRLAKGFLDQGALVPDDVTIKMVTGRLSMPDVAKGAILDGFPRTPAQAEALAKWLEGRGERIRAVLNLRVSDAALIRRISGRRTCRASGHIYHVDFHPPARDEVCDVDGSELYQRDDDRPETVARRIEVYQAQTAPLIEYYRRQDLLFEVDGEQPAEAVTKALQETLERMVGL